MLLLALVIAACGFIAVTPAPIRRATYDQRQTGDLNVQIALKDLRVVALVDSELLDDYTDYDYFYDYADFTIKPGGNRPTTSSTTKKNDITEISEPLLSPNSTIATSLDNINSTERNTTLSNDEEIPNTDPSNNIVNSTSNADNNKSQSNEENEEFEAIVASSSIKPALRSQKRCKSGYVPNGNGRCRRASRPWLSLLP